MLVATSAWPELFSRLSVIKGHCTIKDSIMAVMYEPHRDWPDDPYNMAEEMRAWQQDEWDKWNDYIPYQDEDDEIQSD